jgi:AsmA protein
MKLFLKILGGLFAVFVLLVVAAYVLVSPDRLRERIADRIRQQTGHELSVAGTTTMTLLPRPRIVLTEVSLTDPQPSQNRVDIAVPRLEIDLNLLDMLSPPIDADRVVFVKPVVRVYENGAGNPSRRAALSSPQAIVKAMTAPAPALRRPRFIAADAAGGPDRRHDVRLKDVQVEDGTLRIYGDNGGLKRVFGHIEAALSLPHIGDPLHAKGQFNLLQKTVNFDLTLTSPGSLASGAPADLKLSLYADVFAASFDGRLFPGKPMRAQGLLKGSSPSFRRLLAWQSAGSGEADQPVEASLSGNLDWQPDSVSLSDAVVRLGQSVGRGQAALDTKNPVPHLRAALALDMLDLTPFLPEQGAADAAAPPAETGSASPPPSGVMPENAPSFFVKPGTQTDAAGEASPQAEPPGTSAPAEAAAPQAPAQPLPNVPALFEADVNINIRQTRIADLSIGPTAVGVGLHDRVLTATLGGMQLYGGEGNGKLVIDGSGPVPVFSADLKLDQVQAKPLLQDAAKFQLLSGRTKLTLSLHGQGRTAPELKSSLSGQGSVAVSDGAVSGIDLTQIIADVGKGQIPNIKGGATQFSDLSGSFNIDSGIARTDDIQMLSQLLKVTAAGSVDLPDGTLDILAHPKIVASPAGKGGANDLAGLSIPIRIQGPLSSPSYHAELAGLFDDPEAASKTINRIGTVLQKKFKGKPVGEAIGRFLGSVEIGGAPRPKGSDD